MKGLENISKVVVFGKLKGQFDPTLAFNPSILSLTGCVFDNLLTINSQGEIEGELLNSWNISPDHKTYSFELKQKNFSDGSSVTSYDVHNSIDYLVSEKSHGFHKAIFKSVLKEEQWFELISNKEFKIHLKKPYPHFLTLLSLPESAIIKRTNNILIGSSEYYLKNLAEESLELTSTTNKKIALSMIYGDFIDYKNIKLQDVDYFLGFPPLWLKNLDVPDTHNLNIADRFNIYSILLNHDKKIFKNEKFRKDLAAFFRWIRSQHKFEFPNIVDPYDTIMPRGIMSPNFYKESQNSELSVEEFKKTWGKIINKNTTINVWLPEGFFEESFLELIKNNLKKVGNFRLHTKKFWEVAELFKNNQIDIAVIDSGAFVPSLDGIINTWKVNRLPGFAHAIEKLIQQLEKPSVDLTNENITAPIIKKFETQNWVIPLVRASRVAIVRKGLYEQDQKVSFSNLICK